MRKIMFIGRSEAGKTTLTQAMKGNTITYHKTQYVNHYDVIIDTPGEYLQSKNLISALAVFTAEADVIGLLMDATEPFSLYSPNLTPVCNREVVGVVTKIDHWARSRHRQRRGLNWLVVRRFFIQVPIQVRGLQIFFPI